MIKFIRELSTTQLLAVARRLKLDLTPPLEKEVLLARILSSSDLRTIRKKDIKNLAKFNHETDLREEGERLWRLEQMKKQKQMETAARLRKMMRINVGREELLVAGDEKGKTRKGTYEYVYEALLKEYSAFVPMDMTLSEVRAWVLRKYHRPKEGSWLRLATASEHTDKLPVYFPLPDVKPEFLSKTLRECGFKEQDVLDLVIEAGGW